MRPRDVPVHIRDFIPEQVEGIGDGLAIGTGRIVPDAGLRRDIARGRLCDHIRQLAWTVAMDPGPRAQETVDCIHRITDPAWLDDPLTALEALDALTANDEQTVRLIAERHPSVPAEVLEPKGTWAHYCKAREIFAKYHAALVKMKLAAPVETSTFVTV